MEVDSISGQIKELQLDHAGICDAFKVLVEEQGTSYKELRQDLNTFSELYVSLEARVQASENLLPEILGSKELQPVGSFRSFRSARRELELKHSRKSVSETQAGPSGREGTN